MQNIDFDLVTIPPVFLILNERKHHTNRKHWITLNSSETHRRMHDITLMNFSEITYNQIEEILQTKWGYFGISRRDPVYLWVL